MEKKEQIISDIETQIINNQLKEAATSLKAVFEKNQEEELINESILMLSRLNNLERKYNQGVIDLFDLEFSKVRLALITLKTSAKKVLDVNHKLTLKEIQKTQVPVYQVIFEDDFEDNRNGWGVEDSDAAISSIRNGRLFLENLTIDKSLSSTKNIKIDSKKNFSIKCRITFLDEIELNGYGISWGGSNEGATDSFRFVISSDGYFSIYYFIDSEYFELCDWEENSAIRQGKTMNFLEIVKNGNIMHYKVNGEVVFTSEFISFLGDRVGIVIGPAITVAVDLFQVTN
jgi:hypothetical protein